MKKSVILSLIGLIIASLVIIGVSCTNDQPVTPDEPTEEVDNIIVDDQATDDDPIIGGDQDAYGCYLAAGYQWCEAKQKCLRSWEEACEKSTEDALKDALTVKNGTSFDDYTITITKQEGDYIQGGVSAGLGGAAFFAAKVDGTWVIVFDGQDSPHCTTLEQYSFPESFTGGCYIDPIEGIRDAFEAKYSRSYDNATITIVKETTSFVQGGITEGLASGAAFYATKVDGTWIIVFDGQYTPDCSIFEPYNFPMSLVETCYDNPTEGIRDAFETKYNRSYDNASITIVNETTGFVQGGITEGLASGAAFYAAEVGGTWVIVFDGQYTPDCSIFEPYNFPESLIVTCNE